MTLNKKSQFVCQSCGYITAKWLGQCPECNAWNKLVEETITPKQKRQVKLANSSSKKAQSLTEVTFNHTQRIMTGISELDRVLGKGIVPGSLVLVGGDPGIGKSTLLLQASDMLAQRKIKVLYVSGEESENQIKLRADRMGIKSQTLYLLCENRIAEILTVAQDLKPEIMVIDSIQTLVHPDISSIPGSVSQVRECATLLMELAKNKGPAIFLVGHVTKEGMLAGPRVLEHLVDTVLYFQGEAQQGFRILRANKNRFGSTNEVGMFEMATQGLLEVKDPSRLFLSERQTKNSGSAITVTLEGNRPLLLEVQSLVTTAYFGTPQRRV